MDGWMDGWMAAVTKAFFILPKSDVGRSEQEGSNHSSRRSRLLHLRLCLISTVTIQQPVHLPLALRERPCVY